MTSNGSRHGIYDEGGTRMLRRMRTGAAVRIWLAEHHIECRSALRRHEQQLPAVAGADDAARQGKPDSPSLFLGRESGLENLVADLARYSRTIVGDSHSYSSFGQRFRGDLDLPITASQRVDGILGQRL